VQARGLGYAISTEEELAAVAVGGAGPGALGVGARGAGRGARGAGRGARGAGRGARGAGRAWARAAVAGGSSISLAPASPFPTQPAAQSRRRASFSTLSPAPLSPSPTDPPPKAVAEATGIVLDPVYSGKALVQLIKDMEAAPAEWRGRRVLFIHTGGLLVRRGGRGAAAAGL
jgi:hypothetical protein